MPKFENKWNWTNMIQLFVMLVAGVGVYSDVKSDIAVVKSEVKQEQQLKDKILEEIAKSENRAEKRDEMIMEQIRYLTLRIDNTKSKN